MRVLTPLRGDQQQDITATDVERAVQNMSGVTAGDRDALLLSDAAVATVQRWRLGDNRFIHHQDDRALTCEKPVFKPPFACRHVSGRRARRYRGRFQRIRTRANAKRTLWHDTAIL